jgi:hypothetical protein
MGLIREPLDVDFTVEPQTLTKAEKIAVSEYIRTYKMKEVKTPPGPPANNKVADRKRATVKD